MDMAAVIPDTSDGCTGTAEMRLTAVGGFPTRRLPGCGVTIVLKTAVTRAEIRQAVAWAADATRVVAIRVVLAGRPEVRRQAVAAAAAPIAAGVAADWE